MSRFLRHAIGESSPEQTVKSSAETLCFRLFLSENLYQLIIKLYGPMPASKKGNKLAKIRLSDYY
jgi:hypothetical protein